MVLFKEESVKTFTINRRRRVSPCCAIIKENINKKLNYGLFKRI